MENLNIIANWVENFGKEVFESREYKIASSFSRDELEFNGTQEQFDDLKDRAFYMACELVHIRYILGKMEDYLQVVQKYSNHEK